MRNVHASAHSAAGSSTGRVAVACQAEAVEALASGARTFELKPSESGTFSSAEWPRGRTAGAIPLAWVGAAANRVSGGIGTGAAGPRVAAPAHYVVTVA